MLINIRIATAGLRVTEVPSLEDLRLHGESSLRTFRDGWRVLRTIVREQPLRAFRRHRRSVPERALEPRLVIVVLRIAFVTNWYT